MRKFNPYTHLIVWKKIDGVDHAFIFSTFDSAAYAFAKENGAYCTALVAWNSAEEEIAKHQASGVIVHEMPKQRDGYILHFGMRGYLDTDTIPFDTLEEAVEYAEEYFDCDEQIRDEAIQELYETLSLDLHSEHDPNYPEEDTSLWYIEVDTLIAAEYAKVKKELENY